ncbi:MAG: methyltransferase domain-containing protein [Acidimicrobiales bacterium]
MTTFDGWDPNQYNRFAQQREQPFWDLAHLIHEVPGPRVADLGCGDGRLTALLGAQLRASFVTGLDSSPAMIRAAAAHVNSSTQFALADIGTWQEPDAYDVVFANASLQWVPDHPSVLARWADSLRDGGQLAVQVPANADHPSHVIAATVAAEMLSDPAPDAVAENVLTPERYATVLDELGFVDQHVRLQVYAHRLASTSDVVEWVKGTTLTRFKQALGDEGFEQFVKQYRARLLDEVGDQAPYLYLFKRILMWARRS